MQDVNTRFLSDVYDLSMKYIDSRRMRSRLESLESSDVLPAMFAEIACLPVDVQQEWYLEYIPLCLSFFEAKCLNAYDVPRNLVRHLLYNIREEFEKRQFTDVKTLEDFPKMIPYIKRAIEDMGYKRRSR